MTSPCPLSLHLSPFNLLVLGPISNIFCTFQWFLGTLSYKRCHINTYICSILFFLKISLLDTSSCFCRDWPVSGLLGVRWGHSSPERGVWEEASGQLCLQMRNQASRDPKSQCGWWGSRESACGEHRCWSWACRRDGGSQHLHTCSHAIRPQWWPMRLLGQRDKQALIFKFQRGENGGSEMLEALICDWAGSCGSKSSAPWKDAQHHSLSEKCKSKPQWGTISRQSEWVRSKSLQTINAGEGAEKREPSYTVGGNAN